MTAAISCAPDRPPEDSGAAPDVRSTMNTESRATDETPGATEPEQAQPADTADTGIEKEPVAKEENQTEKAKDKSAVKDPESKPDLPEMVLPETTPHTGAYRHANPDNAPNSAYLLNSELFDDLGPKGFEVYLLDRFENYEEFGDLEALKKRGKLRILVDAYSMSALHRGATQQDIEIEEARKIAEELGLFPVFLLVNTFSDLVPALLAGKGDLIANNLTITEDRLYKIDFSYPTISTRVVLVSRKDEPEVKKDAPLRGKILTITAGTSYEAFGESLRERHSGMVLTHSPRNFVDLAIDVALEHSDFTMLDEHIFDLVKQYRDDLKVNKRYPQQQLLAWGIRKNSPDLLKAINQHVRQRLLTYGRVDRYIGDLKGIKQRGVLRVLLRNRTGVYHMWKGRIMGFEYNTLKDFADYLGVRLDVEVAPANEKLIPMLLEGKGDIVANFMAITERRKKMGVAFSDPYHSAKVGIVARKDDMINSVEDLQGRTIHIRKSSSHYPIVMELKKQYPTIKVQLAPEEMETVQIIDRVAEGKYDLTMSDNHIVQLERTWRDDIHFALDLDHDHDHGWIVRDGNDELLAALNKFLTEKEVRSDLATRIKRYFKNPKRSRPEITKLKDDGSISPYDDLVKKYAEPADFDWRLITAQMFQESMFDPKAKSWVGARGLMQVMPATGRQVGISNLFDPENSVKAGIKYMDWLYRKFDSKGITPENMMWFTLASYNAGLGHVYDAQDLAEQKGWDRKIWFDNVEKAMLLLSDPKYYKRARYGYARGTEPVQYVQKISERFRSYVKLLDAHQRNKEAIGYLRFHGLLFSWQWLLEKDIARRNVAEQKYRSEEKAMTRFPGS
ncbi:hypothetical protein MNKW57_15040 [Biformimicrobium ophioploci]|uniref:Solute-binding protein family 3/N-terminal domain-containing protein n=2 Tax=Biformimicrobium ophioploci TaxID=3036711 RepID=A0ABQ6LYK2_9GAMM|nr:hypothetical protein MNKW57_15040 [Microbulbifer sp. NKW57]